MASTSKIARTADGRFAPKKATKRAAAKPAPSKPRLAKAAETAGAAENDAGSEQPKNSAGQPTPVVAGVTFGGGSWLTPAAVLVIGVAVLYGVHWLNNRQQQQIGAEREQLNIVAQTVERNAEQAQAYYAGVNVERLALERLAASMDRRLADVRKQHPELKTNTISPALAAGTNAILGKN